MIGIASEKCSLQTHLNCNENAWILFTQDKAFQHKMIWGTTLTAQKIQSDSTIRVLFNSIAGRLSFAHNDENFKLAFENLRFKNEIFKPVFAITLWEEMKICRPKEIFIDQKLKKYLRK